MTPNLVKYGLAYSVGKRVNVVQNTDADPPRRRILRIFDIQLNKPIYRCMLSYEGSAKARLVHVLRALALRESASGWGGRRPH